MRTAPRILSLFAILLVLISVLANLNAAVGQWPAPGFMAVLRFPGIMAWLQAQLPFMSWLRPTGQLALVASPDDSLPRMSLSLPAGTTVSTTGGRMIFAQMADGPIGVSGRFYRTSFVLVNDSIQNASGTLAFYDNFGQPLTVNLEGVTAASVPFTLAKGSQRRYSTSGAGDLKVGWAMMLADQPVTGTSEFEIRDSNQKVYGNVGVSESFLGTKFTIFADSMGPGVDTGLALVNPSATDANNLLLELFDPSGRWVGAAPLPLNPMEHASKYLTEFFSTIASIQEFEGTLVISSLDNRKFGGITLRLIGDLMTSVPMAAPPPAGSTKNRLYFPQVADGLHGTYRYRSTILLFNNTTAFATGTVEFFNSDSTPMNVKIGVIQASTFPFTLNPGGAARMLTSGEGTARIGWARVKMDQPISGAAVYHVYNTAGTLLAEAGVASAVISTSFNLIADSIGAFDTGIALANPAENGAPYATVYASLVGKSGSQVASTTFQLDAGKHTALYLTQLFPNYSRIGEFEGRIRIDAGNPIVPLTLRSIEEKLTSVPMLRLTRGFAPTAVVEPVQNLAGSKPAFRWQISQPIANLAINSIQLSAPALGLNPAGLKMGDNVGYGTFLIDLDGSVQGGVVRLDVTGLDDGVSFRVSSDSMILQSSQIGLLQMSGKLKGNAGGGLTIDMTSGNLAPRSTNGGVGISMDFFLRSDLIVAPPTAGTIYVTSVYESPSTKVDEAGVPIQVRIVQPLGFVAPDTVKANLTSLVLQIPLPGTPVRLQGSNLGSQPKIYFTPTGGTRFESIPLSVDATGVEVIVPSNLGDGIIQVDNGQGTGNALYFRSLFAPGLDLQAIGTGNTVPLIFTFSSGAQQLAMGGFTVEMLNADGTLSGFAAGANVGTVTTTGGSSANFSNPKSILVVSSAADKLVLDVSGNGTQKLTIQKVQGTPPGLTFTYDYVNPSVNGPWVAPIVYAFPAGMEFKLSGVPIQISLAGQTTTWGAEIRSTAYGFAGPNYFFRVIFP